MPAAAAKAKAELTKRIPELEETVAALEVLTPEQYQEADEILGMIQTARKDWQTRFYGGESNGRAFDPIIPPLRASLDALYALVRDVDKPLGALEAKVKTLQEDYKREELRQARELEAAKEQERVRIEREKSALLARANVAVSAATRNRLNAQVEQLDAEAEQVEEEYVAPVMAANSSSRATRTWKHVDMKQTLAAIKAGLIPIEVLSINKAVVDAEYKADPEAVENWPGFEGFDDITIVGRRSR